MIRPLKPDGLLSLNPRVLEPGVSGDLVGNLEKVVSGGRLFVEKEGKITAPP